MTTGDVAPTTYESGEGDDSVDEDNADGLQVVAYAADGTELDRQRLP